jgi:hypothetical protein
LTDAGVDWPVPELLHVSVNVSVRGEATTTGSVIGALPRVARAVPDQPSSVPPPLPVQVVAFTEVHVNVVDCPELTEVGEAERVTVRAGLFTVIMA